MTVDVPGNLPYVITTSAISDDYTPTDRGDDFLASFSTARTPGSLRSEKMKGVISLKEKLESGDRGFLLE